MSIPRLIQDYPITFAYGGICTVVIIVLSLLSNVWGW